MQRLDGKRPAHAAAYHEALKLDPEAWRGLQYVGVQSFGDGGPDLELRNCDCGSTLGVDVAPLAVAS